MNRPKAFTSELLLVVWEKKWWWLTPMLLTFLALGILMQFAPTPQDPPFIVSLF
jgi:uncharacterized protein DUF5989